MKSCSTAVLLAVFVIAVTPLSAAHKKEDPLYTQAKAAETRQDWDTAFELYGKAVMADPGNIAFQLALRRVQFQAAQMHVDRGRKLRNETKLEEAVEEFTRGAAISPSLTIAMQELQRTRKMIADKERKLTPSQAAKAADDEMMTSLEGPPHLHPLNTQRITLVMNNQPPRILYETIAKLAGINVVFDPEYPGQSRNYSADLHAATLEQALESVTLQTKSYWKAIGDNTIFVTMDNVTKRREYEDMMVKTMYLQNITTVQELQEIATAVRAVTEVRRLFTYNGQNAIIVRGTVDQVVLAGKLIKDLDKAKAEVVVDVVVMELSKTKTRDLASGFTTGTAAGLNAPVAFTPRNPITTTSSSSGSATTSTAISLGQLGHLASGDFAVTLPGAQFQAVLTNSDGRVLQSPQIRTIESQKASLRIGDKIPFATGSYSAGVAATNVTPLVSTQFQFAEVGVNVDLTPKVHEDEISLHIEMELSTVRERVDIGGVQQPIIGQRKLIHDIRLKEGEVSLLGGLQGLTDSKTVGGIPGISQIPILKRLFGSESLNRTESELVIFIIPHVVRGADLTPTNLRGIAAGTDTNVKLNYGPAEPAH